jgi:hypothetical protein
VRGRDHVKLTARWSSCKRVFAQATATPTALGTGAWVRSHPLTAVFVLVRQPHQGRRDKTASGQRARSNNSRQAARRAREPGLLVASTRLADWSAKHLVKVDCQRMPSGHSISGSRMTTTPCSRRETRGQSCGDTSGSDLFYAVRVRQEKRIAAKHLAEEERALLLAETAPPRRPLVGHQGKSGPALPEPLE